MASLQDIRHRIKSVKNIQQITKAMKMVASARLRRAQSAALANRPYAEKMYQVIMDVAAKAGNIPHPLLAQHETGKILFVVMASDKGLAGAYASNVFKEAKVHITGTNEALNYELENKDKSHASSETPSHETKGQAAGLPLAKFEQTIDKDNVDFITIGKKAAEHFGNHGFNVVKSYTGFSERPSFADARTIATEVMDLFAKGTYQNIYLIYTHFVSAISAVPKTVRLLPLEDLTAGQTAAKGEYIYEPSPDVVLSYALPQYLITMVYAALLQAAASELSSRMTAMSNATDNAQDLMAKLDLHYNKVRQANITREISEIVGGAEALK